MLSHRRQDQSGKLTALMICVLFFCAAGSVLALDPSKKLTQYNLKTWQVAEGLPQMSVQAIAQTREGYLWVGTREGLARFDGVRFVIFDRTNTQQFQSNNIYALHEDHAGALWIGTDGGLLKFETGEFTRYSSENGLTNDSVRALFEDGDGSLWIGTYGGLFRLKNGRFDVFTADNGLSSNLVRALAGDADGNLWIGTNGGGINRLDRNGEIKIFGKSDGLVSDKIGTLYVDRAGALWIGGIGGGLNKFVAGKFTSYDAGDGLRGKFVWSFIEDRDGTLWIGASGGLHRFEDNRLEALTTSGGLSDDNVQTLFEDREGHLWIGTMRGGLNQLKNNLFTTYAALEGLPEDTVWTIHGGAGGSVWVGTNGGLSRLQNGAWRTFTKRDGLADDTVWTIYEDADGTLWIGTNGGVSRLQNGRFLPTLTEKNGLPGNVARSLYVDRAGAIWIGTLGGGLSRYKDDALTTWTTGEGLSSDNVGAILEDRAGNLWIGTSDKGLNRLREGRFTVFGETDGLADDSIKSLYEDADQVLWIGSNGGGLTRLKNGEFRVVTTKDGLFSDVIHSILEDDAGVFWMTGNKGIFRVSRRELNDFLDGQAEKIKSVSNDASDGMRSSECNGLGQPAAWKLKNGELWFPTMRGAATINPAMLPTNARKNANAPPIVLEEISADNNTFLASSGEIPDFAPGTEQVEIHYTGLSFDAPEKMGFRYRLEPFDREWTEAGTRRTAYFTHLPPGQYRFRVAAANRNETWNDGEIILVFNIAPLFYQTWWFFGLCLLSVVPIGCLLHYLRLRRVRARYDAVLDERARIAREMHDTLLQGFVGIQSLLTAAVNQLPHSPETLRRQISVAQNMARHSVVEARRTLADLRQNGDVKNADYSNLETELRRVVERLLVNSRITPEFEISEAAAIKRLPSALVAQCVRIAEETLTNTIKHAAAAEVLIEVKFEPENLLIIIADDGRGFSPERAFSPLDGHFGLLGMRERAEKIKGQLIVESSPAAGTRIILRVPRRSFSANGD